MTDSIGSSSGAAGTPAAPTESLTRMWPAIAVGVGSGLGYGLVIRLLADATKFGVVFGVMTGSFLFLVPLVVGYLTVRPHPRPSPVNTTFARAAMAESYSISPASFGSPLTSISMRLPGSMRSCAAFN